MAEQHTIREGYYFNYLHDAANLYWAARWFELNPSMDDKDKMLDLLIVRKIRKAADSCLEQGITGLKTKPSVAEGMELMKNLGLTNDKT